MYFFYLSFCTHTHALDDRWHYDDRTYISIIIITIICLAVSHIFLLNYLHSPYILLEYLLTCFISGGLSAILIIIVFIMISSFALLLKCTLYLPHWSLEVFCWFLVFIVGFSDSDLAASSQISSFLIMSFFQSNFMQISF